MGQIQPPAFEAGRRLREDLDPEGNLQPFLDFAENLQGAINMGITGVTGPYVPPGDITQFQNGFSHDPTKVILPDGRSVDPSNLPLDRNGSR